MSTNRLSGEHPADESRPKKRLKLRSHVWEHFQKTLDGERAICKYCSKSLSGKSSGGTTHLKRHLDVCDKYPKGDVETQQLTLDLTLRNEGTNSGLTNEEKCLVEVAKPAILAEINQQPTLDLRDQGRNIGLTPKETCPETVAKKAILAEIPFASSDFKNFWYSSMDPTNVEKEIYAYYEREKKNLAIELHNLTSRACFTIDIMGEGYLSLTAHFINADFDLVKKLIGFKKLPDLSSTSVINMVESYLSEWKLQEKVFTFRTEGIYLDVIRSLENKFSYKMLSDGHHINVHHCKKEIEELYYSSLNYLCPARYESFTELLGALTTVPSEIHTFNQIAKERGLSPISEGWFKDHAEHNNILGFNSGSVARMLKDMFIYRDVFSHYDALTETSQPSFSRINSYHFNWEKLQKILKVSEVVNSILNDLSSFKLPTSHLYLRNIFEILDNGGNFYEFSADCNKIFIVAGVLDPRYKLCFFKYCFETLYSSYFAEKYITKCRESLENSFSEYDEVKETNYVPRLLVSIINSQAERETITKRFSDSKRKISELDKYLKEEVIDTGDADFDLLGWWKQNQSRFPILSRMARDILAVPACAYSPKDAIKSDLNALHGVDPRLLEAVICSKDWILGREQRDVSEPKN